MAGKDVWVINPFLFIRGHSCPRSVQTSLTQNCLELTISGFFTTSFPFFVVTLALKKCIGQVLALEVRHQSAFTAFRALLPFAKLFC
jgi:hypothetical protein